MMAAAVRVGALMHRMPPREYSIALIAYFTRNGWTAEEVEKASAGIETDGDLLHMITLDGGLTPRPFVAWREMTKGKSDAKFYTHREACDIFDKMGRNAKFDDYFQPMKTDAGVRFQRIA